MMAGGWNHRVRNSNLWELAPEKKTQPSWEVNKSLCLSSTNVSVILRYETVAKRQNKQTKYSRRGRLRPLYSTLFLPPNMKATFFLFFFCLTYTFAIFKNQLLHLSRTPFLFEPSMHPISFTDFIMVCMTWVIIPFVCCFTKDVCVCKSCLHEL